MKTISFKTKLSPEKVLNKIEHEIEENARLSLANPFAGEVDYLDSSFRVKYRSIRSYAITGIRAVRFAVELNGSVEQLPETTWIHVKIRYGLFERLIVLAILLLLAISVVIASLAWFGLIYQGALTHQYWLFFIPLFTIFAYVASLIVFMDKVEEVTDIMNVILEIDKPKNVKLTNYP